MGLVIHVCSNGVFLMGNDRFTEVTCISYSPSRRNSVRAMGDLMHACCLSLGRWSEPPYLAVICLVSPWWMVPNCPGSLRAWINCWPMHLT